MHASGVSAFKRAATFQEALANSLGPLEFTASQALFMIRQSNGETPFTISFWKCRVDAADATDAALRPIQGLSNLAALRSATFRQTPCSEICCAKARLTKQATCPTTGR